ncbi:MAG TPA: 5-deoxy-glucuronate isomerase, partial [Gemmatimonadota bacterium]|nr:5-deoxy-glucuronate isomerase [Gemmatimonadota bacterium]
PVGDGDVFLVPRGYHGPCVALPGYPMYYLNVLAGPGAERSLAFSDDPAHAWVRPSWEGEARDPRVPMTTAAGPGTTRSSGRP